MTMTIALFDIELKKVMNRVRIPFGLLIRMGFLIRVGRALPDNQKTVGRSPTYFYKFVIPGFIHYCPESRFKR